MNDYFFYDFSIPDVNYLKTVTGEKNIKLDYNNISKNVETRWVGLAGEIAFREWLNQYPEISYKHHYSTNKPDNRDFTVGKLEIDVKTVATNYFPMPSYGCDVNAEQWERSEKNGVINAFVFVRYLLKENRAIVMGFLRKDDFFNKAVFIPSGSQVGKIITSSDMLEVKISELKDLLTIDQWR